MSETRDIFEMSREDAEAFLRARQQQLLPVPVKFKGGYADVPGTGPEGQTCKTCRHLVRKQMAKTYFKCALMRHRWTGGGGSDVKAKAPACARWETEESSK